MPIDASASDVGIKVVRALFALIWIKLIVSAFLDTGPGNLTSKLVDLVFVLSLISYLVLNIDYFMRRCPWLLGSINLLFVSVLLTELVSGRAFFFAMLETFKLLTPIMFMMVGMRLYQDQPAATLIAALRTFLLVFVLAVVGLFALPSAFNRGESFSPAYFSGLHTSAYVVGLAGFGIYYLHLAKAISRRWLYAAALLALTLVFVAWGVRTAMVTLVVFVLSHFLLRDKRAWPALLGFLGIVLSVVLIGLIADQIRIPDWRDLVQLSSGRVSMWVYKFHLFYDSTFVQVLLGKGAGSDFVVSDVWWWGAKDSHNDFLHILTQNGIFGLGAIVLLLFSIWKSFAADRVAAPLMFVYVTASLFSNGLIYRPLAGLVFAIALLCANAAVAVIRQNSK